MKHLLTVKSLVTLFLTLIFGVLLVLGRVTQEFMVIYTVVIGFYFGTQSVKGRESTAETGAAGEETEEAGADAV